MTRQTVRPSLTRLLAAALVAAAMGPVASADDAGRWGPARDDLERFFGLYGTPGDPNGRDYFVAEARSPEYAERKIPEGRMMIGATWGDVAPWYMQSRGDTRFVRPGWNEYNPDIVVEFDTGPDGNATAMRFVEGSLEDREVLERVGDLPEGW